MPTPHNTAQPGDIAQVVLMPGDPLRAQLVADRFLEDPVCFNQVRGMLGFTGTYQGKRISVMGSGMGVPSMAIYAYELFAFYGVQTIIRIGTIGGIADNVNLRDIVLAQGACTTSSFADHYELPGTMASICDFDLLRQAVDAAAQLGATYHVGNVITTDVFYQEKANYEAWARMGVLGTEMETFALYLTAIEHRRRALSITTVSDHVMRGEALDAEARQNSFTQMMEIALAVAAQNAEQAV